MEQVSSTESLMNVEVQEAYLEIKKLLTATEEQVERLKGRERDYVKVMIDQKNQLLQRAADLFSAEKKYTVLRNKFNDMVTLNNMRKCQLKEAKAELKRLRRRCKKLEDQEHVGKGKIQSEENEGTSQKKTSEHLFAEEEASKLEILEMHLEEMENKIRSLTQENEYLKSKDSDNERTISRAFAFAEEATFAKEEALAKLEKLTGEADKRRREYAQHLEDLEAANAQLRAELQKLNQQFDQSINFAKFAAETFEGQNDKEKGCLSSLLK